MLLLLFACKAPEAAPTELEELAHFFLVEYDGEDPDTYVDGMLNLEAWYDAEVGEGDLIGTLEDLSAEEIAAVGMPDGVDPSEAVGVFHLVPQQCTVDDIVGIFLYPQQDELFESNYDRYERSFLADPECFRDRSCAAADWDIAIESTLVGQSMAYTLRSGLRWVEDADGVEVLASRTLMFEPAEVDGFAYFDQSYQAEVYREVSPGVTLHFYALWNAGGAEGLDPDAPFWKDQYVDGIVDWDERIDELCAQPELWK